MPASCIAPALMTAWTAVARNFGAIASGTGAQLLHHADFHASARRARELHVVHEAAHEEDPAPARLQDVLGRERIGDGVGIEALALIGDANDELRGFVARREGEFDGDELAGILAVAVLDGVDDGLAAGDADPVRGVFVERGHMAHAIAEDLHEVHHVEQARNLQPHEAAGHRHGSATIIQYGCSMTTTGFAAIPRVSRVAGRVRVPGDKSISHRYAMLAAIADGESRLTRYAPGADCAATLACMEALGVRVSRPRQGSGERAIVIEGCGPRGLRAPSAPLDAANSGTSMRLLAGLLAAHPFTSVIGGDASLSRRPMRRVIDPLTRMGSAIESSGGRPPLTIHGATLRAITHEPEVPSAQVKSAVLLAGLHADGRTAVKEPTPTRDHTERALEAFGGRVVHDGDLVAVDGGQCLRAITADVPGDISSALFWLALAGGTPDADLTIDGVGLNPSRTAVFDVLRRAGAILDLPPGGRSDLTASGEPSGSIRVRFGNPQSFEI